jgi:hypothetical protein
MARTIADLIRAREEAVRLEARLADNSVGLREATARLDELGRTGATAAERRRAEREIASLREERDAIAAERGERLTLADTIRDELVLVRPLEDSVAELAADVPVVLLPVRIETRFSGDRRRLRIRVFPDSIHVPNHDPELTPEERAAAETYWRARWDAGGDTEAETAAWEALAASLTPTRGAWAAKALTPTNVDDLGDGRPKFPDVPMKAAPWHRAPRVEALPDRWVAVGYAGGREVLRKWGAAIPDELTVGPIPDPAADAEPPSAEPPPADQSELPDGLLWLTDYAEAERGGMAITVEEGELSAGSLADGLDLLVVLGVDWTLDPDEAAGRIAGLLDAHRHSAGVSLLRQGAPTNVTGEARPEPRLDGLGGRDALDPAAPPEARTGEAGARRVAKALGLPEAEALDRTPGGGDTEDLDARHMQNALWEATWGYFLDQIMDPLVDDATASDLRDHARRYVRGRGPLPVLRVGDQPYGLLPVLPHDRFRPRVEGELEQRIHRRLGPLRALWERAADAAPALGRSGRPDRDLVDVLAMTPRAASFRFREAIGPVVQANTFGMDLTAVFQGWVAAMLLGMAGIEGLPFAARMTISDDHRRLTIPLVQRGVLSETDPLTNDYIRSVIGEVRSAGGFLRLLRHEDRRDTLLHHLLAHSGQLEVAKGATRVVAEVEVATGVREELRPKVAIAEQELHQVAVADEGGGRFITSLENATSTAAVATKAVRSVSGERTLANHFTTLTVPELRAQEPTRELAGFIDSLEHLAKLPSAALERLLTETLDCASHRVDAWATSIAARRLDRLRGTRAAGAHLGAFGWVEDLRPAGRGTSLGYVQAPSLRHAAAAAVLRSGHLSHRATDTGALSVDLSSERVRLALEVLDGVRQGQQVGALLGYRFERGLRERRLTLAQYILPIRRLAPLSTSTDAREGNEPLEAIAARDVVDGVRLLARWRDDPAALFAQPDMPGPGSDRDDVTAELERLADVLDAMSDLLLAESVYQAVSGNSERAGAALDALDRQTGLPEVQVADTPRAGTGFNHRLVLLLGDAEAPAGWDEDPRGAAEPRLNAWIARLLGNPDRIRCAAEVLDADGSVLKRLSARLGSLNLSPLATVLAATSGARDEGTELEQRLALRFAELPDAGAAAAELRLLDTPPPGAAQSVIGLGELRTLAQSIVDLVSSARPARARDLAPESERVATGVADGELATRAGNAVTVLKRAADGLDGLPENATPARIRRALLAAAAAGVAGAVPAASDREGLAAQAAVALGNARTSLEALDTAEDDFDRAAADPAQRVAHDLERLRGVFGASFPALPRFEAANAGELDASHKARSTLLGGDDLAPAAWLQRVALVRPAVSRLHDVLTAAEALGRQVDPAGLVVCQLPALPGDRWLALGLPEDRTLPRGALSVVACAPDGFDPAEQLAGLVVDQWTETLPATSQTTGLTFHYDAPGARAPQCVLLAVPPDPAAERWDFDSLLGAVREARDLARLRLVDLQSVEGASRFLPALWFPFNLQAESPWIDFGALQNAEVVMANEHFLSIQNGGG